MAKGIRVNQLAKELGVESKTILSKCRAEGLSDQVPNHMSVLSIGLAETVREWFAGHGSGGTAVETAAPVEVATKPKTARSKKKKEESGHDDEGDGTSTAVAEAPVRVTPSRVSPEEVETATPETAPVEVAKAPAHVEPEKHVDPVAKTVPPADVEVTKPVVHVETPAVTVAAPPAVAAAPIAPPADHAPAIAAEISPPTVSSPAGIAASAPTVPAHTGPAHAGRTHATPTAGAKPAHAAPGEHSRAPAMRPTVTLASRAATQGGVATPPIPEKKPASPPPKMMVPTPAQISGPKIVRIEKEETIDTRGPRSQRPGTGAPTAGFTAAPPRGGRGVKVSEEEETEEARKKANAKKGNSLSSRRRGVDGRRGEAMEKLKEFTHADLIERQERLNSAGRYAQGVSQHLNKSQHRGQHAFAKTIIQKGEAVEIEEPVTAKSLSAALGLKSSDIMSKLIKQGIFATVNQALDIDVAMTIALEFGIELKIAKQPTLEETLLAEFDSREVPEGNLRLRPPVVTILGHVDHGKTSLLDKIRHANVAAGEAGGITQHTAAWMVTLGEGADAKRVTFIDTPGHQAFTSMRARGANMTDVVVLVVSAAEGVQPQTIESINHARAAGVPIVVALNKIDRPDANPDMVLGQLAAQGLNPVEWGGDTEVIRTSATTGQGIPDLIEILHYQAELLELTADPQGPARGTVIESRVDEGLGSVATVLIQDGTLHIGDIGLSGPGFGRIRSLLNDRGEMIQEAGPATPVLISGLSVLPGAGDKFYVVDDVDRARAIAEERSANNRSAHLAGKTQVTAENLFATFKAGEVSTVNLIIKADVQGSVETLTKSVTDSNTDEVKVKVIHSGAGPINESDVELAMATRASFIDKSKDKVAIIGFHVIAEDAARLLAEQNRIDVKLYRVIYEIFDDLKKALSGMLTPEVREKLHGHAEIRQVFKVSRIGNIGGCMVTDGHIQRGSKIRLIRNGSIITEDLMFESLKRGKDNAREVKSGFECGIKLAGYDDIKVGDVLEAYIREEFERTL